MSPVKVLSASAMWMPRPRNSLALTALWVRAMAWLTEDYRPEKHYMRGPGPKWRAKYGHDRGSLPTG